MGPKKVISRKHLTNSAVLRLENFPKAETVTFSPWKNFPNRETALFSESEDFPKAETALFLPLENYFMAKTFHNRRRKIFQTQKRNGFTSGKFSGHENVTFCSWKNFPKTKT